MSDPSELGAYSPELQECLYKHRLGPGQIRLLSFITVENSVLHCDLRVVDFPTDGSSSVSGISYHGLSYVWGSQEHDLQKIFCNSQILLVTRNLCTALTAIWTSSPHVRLWADALCINQYDNLEKGAQVSRMHEIYSSASCVRIWLGDMSDLVQEMLPFLPEYDQLGDTSYSGNQSYGEWSCNCLSHTGPTARPKEICLHRLPNCLRGGDPALKMWEAVLRGLDDLLSREWFGRARTMQEAILASRAVLHFGGEEMEWEVFRQRCRKSDGSGLQIRNYLVQEFFAAREALEGRVYGLSHFLLLGWPREAWDPRDKVFSLFGLLPEQPFQVDYERSVRDVFVAATRACIATEKNLRVLGAAGLIGKAHEVPENESKCKDFGNCSHANGHCEPGSPALSSAQREFPSWVPDWRASRCRKSVDQTDWSMTFRDVDAAHIGGATAFQPINDSSGCLLLRGLILGRFSSHPSFQKPDGATERSSRQRAGAFVEFPACARGLYSHSTAAKSTSSLDEQVSHLSRLAQAVRNHDLRTCDCSEDVRHRALEPLYTVATWELPAPCTDGDFLCILDGAAAPSILRPTTSPHLPPRNQHAATPAFLFVGNLKPDFYENHNAHHELLNLRADPIVTYLDQRGVACVQSRSQARKELARSETMSPARKARYSEAFKVRRIRAVRAVEGVVCLL